jgi:adenosylcobinamide-GDP ribazoletransferase
MASRLEPDPESGRSTMHRLLLAFRFLTSLPLGTAGGDARDIGRSIAFFPLVGAALGVMLAVAAWLTLGRLPIGVVAVGLTALLAVLTAGLHLDGVADVFDALGGGRGDRERMLEIMRDSRIGAHGAMALALVLAGKIAALPAILAAPYGWRALVAATTTARFAAVLAIALFSYARSTGLGRPYKDHSGAAQLVQAAAIWAVVVIWAGPTALMASAIALLVSLLFAVWMNGRLGGLTGDVYGAVIEIGELVFLVSWPGLAMGKL